MMKKWYKSKTIVFNLVSALLVGGEQYFSLLQPILEDKTYGAMLFAITMANIFLRTITTTGVTK